VFPSGRSNGNRVYNLIDRGLNAKLGTHSKEHGITLASRDKSSGFMNQRVTYTDQRMAKLAA
jgi:hypothetical protein